MKDPGIGRVRHTMKKFSEEIKAHCERSGLKQTEIARAVGLNAATVCKVINGDSSAATWDNILLICGELCLSSSSLEHLRSTYEKEYYTEEEQLRHQAFINMLSNLERMTHPLQGKNSMPVFAVGKIEGTELYYGINNVMTLITQIVSCNASENDECIVRISSEVPKSNDVMRHLTANMNLSTKRLTVRHMVALESKSPTSVSANFTGLCNVMPVLLSGNCDYIVNYYYRQDGANLYEPFPSHVITEDHLILISDDFEEAIVTDKKDIIDSYRRRFDRALARTRRIRAERRDVLSSINELGLSSFDDGERKVMTVLSASPPIAYLLGAQALRDHVCDGYVYDGDLINGMLNKVKKWEHEHYITLDGIDRFIDTGICCDPRHVMFDALSLEERLTVLERLREIVLSSGVVRIIRPGRLFIPFECCIEHISQTGLTIIVKDDSSRLRVLSFTESSSVNAADSFAQHLSESMLAHTPAEAAEHLTHRINALRERIEKLQNAQR